MAAVFRDNPAKEQGQPTVRIAVPPDVVEAHRPPRKTAAYKVTVNAPVWPGTPHTTPLEYTAVLYGCCAPPVRADRKPHRHTRFFLKGESVPDVDTCPVCGADAEALTKRYRWVPTGDGDYCHGCGAGWNDQTRSAKHTEDCPYEQVGSTE